MLRLPPTTISLTMTEVKDFERRRRFKNYLAKENAIGQLPIRLKPKTSMQCTHEPEHCSPEQMRHVVTPKPFKMMESSEDLKLLSCSPRRRPKTRDSVGGFESAMSSYSKSRASSSSAGTHFAENTGSNLPISLPPPFSLERRVVSDVQSLPSGRAGVRPETPQEGIGQESPATPIQQSSMRESSPSTPSEIPQSSGTGTRIFNSAARLVESIVRFPRHSSPTPSPRHASTESRLQPVRADAAVSVMDASGFTVYDDSLPASLQPQTPQNLPEARHQSRIAGFYTVSSRPTVTRRPAHRVTASLSRSQGDGVPTAFALPGFQGLYAGTENLEDATLHDAFQSYHEGSPGPADD